MKGSAPWLKYERYHGEDLCVSGQQQICAAKAIPLVIVCPCPQQHLGNLEDGLIVISSYTELKRSKANKVQYVDFGSTTDQFQRDLEIIILDRVDCSHLLVKTLLVVMQRAPPLATLPGVG